MTEPRPGSRKATVFKKYFAEGLDAAILCGVELKLAVGTIKSWVNTWTKGAKGDAPGTTPVAPKSKRFSTRPRVIVKFDPTREAVVVEQGPDQSTIRWLDDNQDRHFSNTVLEFISSAEHPS